MHRTSSGMTFVDLSSRRLISRCPSARASDAGHVAHNHKTTGRLCWHCVVVAAASSPLIAIDSVIGECSVSSPCINLLCSVPTLHLVPEGGPVTPRHAHSSSGFIPRRCPFQGSVRLPPGNSPSPCGGLDALIPALPEQIGGSLIVTPGVLPWECLGSV